MSAQLQVIVPITLGPAQLVATDVPEADAPAYNPVTVYATGQRCLLDHVVYETSAATTGVAPPASPWMRVGLSNRWRAFDGATGSATVFDRAAYYELAPPATFNHLALLALAGVSWARARLTDAYSAVVFEESVSLMHDISHADWWTWTFEPREAGSEHIFTGLPVAPGGTLRLDFAGDPDAQIGDVLAGVLRDVGAQVIYGARASVLDYSRKERDEWGEVVLQQRAWARQASLSLEMDDAALDAAFNTTAGLRAKPTLWLIDDGPRALMLLGFWTRLEFALPHYGRASATIDLESVT